VLAPTGAEPPGPPPELPARRSLYPKLLVAGTVALLLWVLVPRLPQDQNLVFALGPHAERVSQLEVEWEAVGKEHAGSLTLNFPSLSSERVARQLRLANGDYTFRVSARRRDAPSQRPEVTRNLKLEGGTLILHLEDLSE
jgi:hypothetical protein